MVVGGCVWLQGGMCGCGGEHVWLPGDMHVCRGVCVVAGGHAWLGGVCVGYDKIQSMSGRYASYWNAFLFYVDFQL